MGNAFNIDKIEFVDKERRILKIEGFFHHEKQQKLFVKTETQKLELKKTVLRYDVAHLFSSKNRYLGFVAYLFLSEKDKVAEIFSEEDNHSYLVRKLSMIESSKEKDAVIQYSIDSYKKISMKKYLIEGWCFSLKNLSKSLEIHPKNITDYTIEMKDGSDVKQIHNSLKLDSKIRFKLFINQIPDKKTKIVFSDGIISKEIEIQKPRFNEKSKVIKGLKHIKNNGLLSFISFMKSRKNNIISYEKFIQNEKKLINNVNYSLEIKNFSFSPKISFVMATYNSNEKYLRDCIDSVIMQKYTNWELCIADDASQDNDVTKNIIVEYAKKDKRIKYIIRDENGHISKATNSALSIATGEYITLIDHDDIVSSNALFEFVKVLNSKDGEKFKLIYSDEDKLSKEGVRFEPYFKPDFSPETFNSIMYIGHLSLYKREILDEIGGFDNDYIGCQDYEMTRRYISKIKFSEIKHIQKILYHWRIAEGSIAENPDNKSYAFENAKKAITRDLKLSNFDFNIENGPFPGTFSVEYLPISNDLVTIIICIKDKVDYLIDLMSSINETTTYKNYEIIIVDNNSVEFETLRYLDEISKEENISILRIEEEFNFSRLNNIASESSKGKYLLFLNNDIVVITPTWIEKMLGYAQQPHIGAVGAKLLYEDNTIQHGGVVIGYGNEGIAGHIFGGETLESSGYYSSLKVPYNYSAVTAACLMISKEKFYSIGKFDETFKVAYNDVDMCLRLLENGYYNVALPEVNLYHYESKSRGLENTPEKLERYFQEIRNFKSKWDKYIKNDPFYNLNLSLSSATPYLPIANKDEEFKNKLYETVN